MLYCTLVVFDLGYAISHYTTLCYVVFIHARILSRISRHETKGAAFGVIAPPEKAV